MAVAAEELRERPVVVEESMARRIGRAAARAPVHLALLFIGLMWLLPTFALFMTSLMTPQDYNAFGWWRLLSEPSLATWNNYSTLWNDSDIPDALVTTLLITIGGRSCRSSSRLSRGTRSHGSSSPGATGSSSS